MTILRQAGRLFRGIAMATQLRGAMVEWKPSYALGLEEMDAHHQTLFATINELWYAVIDRHPTVTVGELLNRLERYAVMHFSAEEALMLDMDYPNFRAHEKAHRRFIRQILKERQKHASGAPVDLEILRFLENWWTTHIQVLDREYAEHLARKQQPRTWLNRLFATG